MVSNFTSLGIKLAFDTSIWIWLFTLVVVIALIGSYRAVSSFLK
jgi:hypothetical protein